MIRARLKSAVPLVDQVAEHIIGGGGKRLRPLLCVLAGRACGIETDKHIEAAAFIEFVHTATLLHDDVVDGSQKRRGRATANNIFGNQASVLVGDFVYSRAFQMMAHRRLAARHGDHGGRHQRDRRGRSAAAHECARSRDHRAALSRSDLSQDRPAVRGRRGSRRGARRRAGRAAGRARALTANISAPPTNSIDDVLDYKSDPATRGKNLGDDLAEGKPTLPLLHALRHGNDEQRALIRLAIEQGGLAQLGPIVEAIESTGGLDYATGFAQRETAQALAALEAMPETPYSRALASLARFAQERTS